MAIGVLTYLLMVAALFIAQLPVGQDPGCMPDDELCRMGESYIGIAEYSVFAALPFSMPIWAFLAIIALCMSRYQKSSTGK